MVVGIGANIAISVGQPAATSSCLKTLSLGPSKILCRDNIILMFDTCHVSRKLLTCSEPVDDRS